MYTVLENFLKEIPASMVIQLGHQILSGKAPRLFKGSDKILRDFIYIDDAIQANIKACVPKKNGVYNVGTGVPRSFQDIADILQKELGTNFETQVLSPILMMDIKYIHKQIFHLQQKI